MSSEHFKLDPVYVSVDRSVPSNHALGFSLLELSVVLMVTALMLGGVTQLSAHLGKHQRFTERKQVLEESRQALLAYAAGHGHLPCPTPIQSDGELIEARLGQVCSSLSGYFPKATLGVRPANTNRLLYTVSAEFSDQTPRLGGRWPCDKTMQFASFNLCDKGQQKIFTVGASTSRVLIADDIVAVLVDTGSNAQPRNARELENFDHDQHFIYASHSYDFDDHLIWISANILKYQLVNTGMMR